MGYRGWFTQVNPENLAEFRDDIRRNPNAYGLYYVIDIAADIQIFRKGFWAAWAGDGDGSLSRDMPGKYLKDTVYLDDVLEKYPDWRADPDRYGRCDFHVTAGGLSLAEGTPDKYPPWQTPEIPDLEDWFLWAEERNALLDASLNQPPMNEDIDYNLNRLDEAMTPVLDRLTQRNAGVDPQSTMSIPEIVEWAETKFGYDDCDVAELRELHEEYDSLRERRIRDED
jgi:hypothetical protein